MKKNKRLPLVLLLCLIVNLSFSQNYFEEGDKEYDLGNFSKAIELFTKAILNDQEIGKSLMLRGGAKIFLDQYNDALTDLEFSKQIDSTNPYLYFYFGKYYRLTGKYDLAISNYSRTIASDPKHADSWFERSGAKQAKNDLEGALADANTSISIDSTYEGYYSNRGYIKFLLKRYADAINDLTSSLKIKPTQSAYGCRGVAWSLINEHQKAIEDFTKSLGINPQDGEIFYYRGLSYKTLSKKAEACADLKKSNELGYSLSAAVLKELNCNH
jgi:tetratricopeptide (TPR) repeat protein